MYPPPPPPTLPILHSFETNTASRIWAAYTVEDLVEEPRGPTTSPLPPFDGIFAKNKKMTEISIRKPV